MACVVERSIKDSSNQAGLVCRLSLLCAGSAPPIRHSDDFTGCSRMRLARGSGRLGRRIWNGKPARGWIPDSDCPALSGSRGFGHRDAGGTGGKSGICRACGALSDCSRTRGEIGQLSTNRGSDNGLVRALSLDAKRKIFADKPHYVN